MNERKAKAAAVAGAELGQIVSSAIFTATEAIAVDQVAGLPQMPSEDEFSDIVYSVATLIRGNVVIQALAPIAAMILETHRRAGKPCGAECARVNLTELLVNHLLPEILRVGSQMDAVAAKMVEADILSSEPAEEGHEETRGDVQRKLAEILANVGKSNG